MICFYSHNVAKWVWLAVWPVTLYITHIWGVSSIGQLKHLRLLSSNFEPVPAEWVGQRKWVGSHGGAEWVGQRKWVESHGSLHLAVESPQSTLVGLLFQA